MIKRLLPLLFVGFLWSDNEIYVDQVGTSLDLTIEQLGSSNIVGGLNATSGSMTALDLDGNTQDIIINQIGDNNLFRGDIASDTFTMLADFDGDGNSFTIQIDPTDTYGADSTNLNIDVDGSSNTFSLDQATSDLAGTLDLDWIIQGDSNQLTFDIDTDQATSYVDIDGDSNQVTYDGDGYASTYFYLDQTGNSRTFNVDQQSTLASDWLKITSSGNNGTVCVVQSDGGTTTSCP